ncbi:MAG: substrate-binding domain-containing protein [Blastochloris sp.]|jgi:LacI family transcriptional regulator|nr:substrate-binding domain-containing protein [Blastochloris sp.]
MTDTKKDTARLSFDSKERALSLLRTLIRSRYIAEVLPSAAELSRILRIPKTAIDYSLEELTKQRLIEARTGEIGYHYIQRANPPSGEVILVVNRDILRGWYSLILDWMIGVEETLFEEGYELRAYSGFHSAQEKMAKIAEARHHGCMGVVLPNHVEPQVIAQLVRDKIPAVTLGNATLNQEEIGCICSDNRAGMEKLLAHLFSENHKRIAMYVTGLNVHDGYRERFLTYQQVMRQHGQDTCLDMVFYDNHTERSARRAAEIYYGLTTKPTAIVCGSDREAFELVSELHHLKIEVPKHVSVVGFDNNHFGQMLEPPMTTIDIYSSQMGRVAANYLLNEMQTPQLPVKILLPTELIVRGSTLKR